ncbi:hypothetical protein [Streptomyces phaeoluteigriseus]
MYRGTPAARRQALAGIVGRCAEAERRLDASADGFRRLRGLEQGVGAALGVAEARFRELTGRTAAAEAVLAELRARYAAPASATVTGYVEQAKDRLVFATVQLNQARQADDSGRPGEAARRLRTAEGAVAQAAVFVGTVRRTADELREAAGLVPAALTGAEAALAPLRATAGTGGGDLAHVLRADAVLSSVRQEVTSGRPYDPVGVLRRIVAALPSSDPARSGVLAAAARLTAGSATAAAADFVATHRGAVGAVARTRLAEAHRLLADGDSAAADALALEARALAEQDVRVRGNPYTPAPAGTGASRPAPAAGTAGAVLGGIVPAEDPENAHPAGFTGRAGGSGTPPA